MCRIFAQRGASGSTDLEAIESALRSSLHQAGAKALNELLQFDAPALDQRQLPCPCGHEAQYQQLRSRPVLTVVGWTRMERPWYLCAHCHEGQFPTDEALDVKGTDFSPGVLTTSAGGYLCLSGDKVTLWLCPRANAGDGWARSRPSITAADR